MKSLSKQLTRQTLGIFWRHAKRYPWHIAGVVGGVFVYNGFRTYLPLLYRDLIDLLSSGTAAEHLTPAVNIVVLVAILSMLRMTLWRLSNLVNNRFQPQVMKDLTTTCYRYLQHHSVGFFNSSFVGSLVTKVKRYERSFERIADQTVYDLGGSLLDVAMVLGVLLWEYQTFGLILLAWCAVFLFFAYLYSLYKLPYDIRKADADTQTTAQLADSMTNNVNVKLFTGHEMENERFDDVTQRQSLARRKSWDLGTIGDVVQATSMIFLELVMMYVAVQMWSRGEVTVGDLALLQAYLGRVFDKLWNTGKNVRDVYEALADANEMTEMLLQPHEVQDVPGATMLKPKEGMIEFRGVSFGYYAESAILDGFDLRIKPGERVAFVGPSGGGKSTIVKLLFRFHDIQGGEITIDGENIARVTQDSLRAALSLVPQEPILFHRSLMENIRYARPEATDEEVIEAARLAHAHEFISSFTQGYATLVGERGVKLSGGERQRVAIARAILKNAPILVLDEATSSLDSESEMFIQDALQKLMKGRTTIVIAHRLSTIMQMDRILVIDGGKIVEEGKHGELLKAQQGLYQKLWEIRAGGFASPAADAVV